MNKVNLDQELRARLDGLNEETMICDEGDQILGYFVPLERYQQLLYPSLKIPLSEEELARRKQEAGGGCSLEEFWRRMGQR
jgi:hypothetical protein